MRKLLVALLPLLLWSSAVLAQFGPSSNGPMYGPNWAQGFVPTPAAWQLMWTNKMDYFPGGLPVAYGGCGSTTPSGCLSNLGAMGNSLANGSIYIGNASNVATARAVSGDATLSFAGSLIVTKTNGVAFGAFATGTNAASLTGTVANARLAGTGGTTVNGQSCVLGAACTVTAVASSIALDVTTLTGTTHSNGLLFNAAGTASNLATGNNGLLVTDGSGVPSIATAIPSGVTFPSPGAIGGVAPAAGTFTTVGATSNIFAVSALTTWANNQTCTAGQMTWDANFIYVCTATNTVKRAALSTF